MDVGIANRLQKKIKYCLVFFYICSLVSCHQAEDSSPPVVHYKDNKAVAVSFRTSQSGRPIRVFLSGEENTPVLGEFTDNRPNYTFVPSVPFTAGYSYAIWASDDSIAGFKIRDDTDALPPAISAFYPQVDTVPENLLKCYLQFSQPMQAVGNATDFVEVTDLEHGEVVEVILELENELWNRDHSRLTLWIDPGRIKTGLIPNQTRGKPLLRGKEYRIRISKKWRSARGIPMSQDYSKYLHVVAADKSKPDPREWKLEIPQSGGIKPLKVNFSQPVDLLTVVDVGRITGSSGELVAGRWEILPGSSVIIFIPEKSWQSGNYNFHIGTGIEDLAGNTVNRLFDTDLRNTKKEDQFLNEIVMPFSIAD